ncbi:MAG: hypothetical protein H7329_02665 [Opitutaceae bacterium]|nr:hypothetical protein [Cytophagales bacterium]
MDRSAFQERLVGLFLRLNGYFQTGYMPHSEIWGHNGTDFDRVGIRFPLHSQSERGEIYSDHLDIQKDAIDIIIAEVKNATMKFNDAIKSVNNRSDINITQLLRWCGLFEENELINLTVQFLNITDNDALAVNESFAKIEHNNRFGAITIRPIIFSIETAHAEGENIMFINGINIIEYLWECLCPDEKRVDCSTRYPFKNWGFEYADIVGYIKERHIRGEAIPTTSDLYNAFNI